MAAEGRNQEQRAGRSRQQEQEAMRRTGVTYGDLELQRLLGDAASSPGDIERDELFRILTGESVEGADPGMKPKARKLALDLLGTNTRATRLGNPYGNKGVLQVLAGFYPQDRYFKSLYAGLRGK